MRINPKRAHAGTALDLPKLRVREQGVPAKVLLVDDDELELSLMADRLAASGFQPTVARNGEEALKILERQWFPVVLTDWQMPVMDGIQLIEKLRERGGDDSYFIMLSVRASSEDFERGYCAGVDDYLSKKSPDTEILARIEAGLNTVALRRSLRQSRVALAMTQSQAKAKMEKTAAEKTDADAKAQLILSLQSEMARARRYRRPCSVLVLGIHPPTKANAESAASSDIDAIQDSAIQDSAIQVNFSSALVLALQGVIRIDIDTIVLYQSSDRHLQFAIVLPETGPAEIATIRSRVRAALLQCIREQSTPPEAFDVSVGAASVDPAIDRPELAAEELLVAAENCRQCMASCGERRLAAVQSSVVSQVAIPCRYGYAVADHCLELEHRDADVRQITTRTPSDKMPAIVASLSSEPAA